MRTKASKGEFPRRAPIGYKNLTLADKTNTTWNDGSTTDKTLNWEIKAKEIAVEWGNETSFIYDGKSHAPTVTTPVDGVKDEKINLDS